MKIMTKLKKKQICTALTCGLLFTVGGQWEKAEAADALYAVTEGGESEITGVKAEGDTLILIGTTGNIPDKVKASDVVFTVSGESWNNVYGGIRSSNNSGDAINNSITISGGTVGNRVYGGVANPTDAKAENNTAVISGGTVGAVYGGYSFTGGAANLNRGIISGGKVNGDIYGGYAKVDSANKNQVIISGTADINTSDGVKRIYGGYSEAGNNTVDGNSVTIEGGTFTGAKEIYGGWTNGNGSGYGGTNGIAQNNTVTVEGGTFNHKVNIYGGYSGYGIASGNKAVINGGKVGNVYGGSSHSYASGNSVNISGGTIGGESDNVYGGRSNSLAERNEVNVSGGSVTFKGLYGGYSNNSMVISNVVNISGGSVTGSGRETIEGLGGGHASYSYGVAEGNVVNISGGTFKDMNIYGAYGKWAAKNNTVNISGGSFTNVGVYAAAGSDNGQSYGNTVNLIGKGGTLNVTLKVVPKLRADGTLDTTQDGTPLKGDVSNAGTALTLGDIISVSTGNTLNIAGTDTTVTNVAGSTSDKGFTNVNFFTNDTMADGSTMLTAGTADITGAKVNAALSGKLADGTITLLKADTLTDTDAKYSINETNVTLGTKLGNTSDNKNYLVLRYTALEKSGNSLQLQNENWGAVGTYNGEGKETAALSEGDTGIKNVAGAYSDTGDATGGKVIINGGSYENVYGGYSASGAVTGNSVTINGGTITNVYGGYSSNTDAVKNNVIAVSGGEITGTLKAEKELTLSGGTFSGTADISAAGSTVKISGSTVSGIINGNEDETNGTDINITGGTLEGTAKITGNTITLNGNTNTESFLGTLAAHLIDLKTTLKGRAHLVLTGSELNIRTLNNTAADIIVPAAGGELNFYIPKEATDGSTMLTLKENTNISNSKVTVGIQNGSALKVKDKINLITMEGGKLTAENLTYLQPGESVIQSENLAKQYKLKTEANENGMVTTVSSLGPGENSKSYVETMAANLAMLNMSSDLMAGAGLEQAAMAANSEGEQNTATLSPFAAISGKKMRSHSGSYVDSRSWGIDVGMSKTINNRHGKLLFGPLVEYAKGSYDSHLDNGTRGDGNSHSWGIGGFAKQEFKDGTYLEGSLRAGRISSDYQSAELGSYNTSATYISAHLGLGQEKQLGAKDSIDYYGKYFYTHQSSDDVNIHEGGSSDRYHFDAVKSSRMKLGLRWNHQVNKYNTLYLGGAWQYEFDGSARATYEGEAAPSPSVKGSTGIFELGWKTKSSKGGFETGLGLTGSIGKQEGIGMNAYFQWNF